MQHTTYEQEMSDFVRDFPLALSMWKGARIDDEGTWTANVHDWYQMQDKWRETIGEEFLLWWDLPMFLSQFFRTTRHGKLACK